MLCMVKQPLRGMHAMPGWTLVQWQSINTNSHTILGRQYRILVTRSLRGCGCYSAPDLGHLGALAHAHALQVLLSGVFSVCKLISSSRPLGQPTCMTALLVLHLRVP